LLAKLYGKNIKALNVPFNESYLWADFSIVLKWIQGPPNNWKKFIGNRVAFIQEGRASSTWRHVPTQYKRADLISSGIDRASLANCKLFRKGPNWPSQEPTTWPALAFNKPLENLEIRHVYVASSSEDITSRFSKFNKLFRVIAYCRRIITTADNLKSTGNTYITPCKNYTKQQLVVRK
jgi:hypothetical protein